MNQRILLTIGIAALIELVHLAPTAEKNKKTIKSKYVLNFFKILVHYTKKKHNVSNTLIPQPPLHIALPIRSCQ